MQLMFQTVWCPAGLQESFGLIFLGNTDGLIQCSQDLRFFDGKKNASYEVGRRSAEWLLNGDMGPL